MEERINTADRIEKLKRLSRYFRNVHVVPDGNFGYASATVVDVVRRVPAYQPGSAI